MAKKLLHVDIETVINKDGTKYTLKVSGGGIFGTIRATADREELAEFESKINHALVYGERPHIYRGNEDK